MTDIFEKYKDYIIFTSIKQEIPVTYFKHNKLYIGIHTNKTEYLRYVCDARFLYKNCPEDKIIGNIFLYFDENMFAKRYDYQTYNDGEYVLKSHPMYIEGVNNTFFEIDGTEIHIYHYPREVVNIFHKKSLQFYSFISSKKDVIGEALFGIKKILSRYNYFNGVYSIHGAAVAEKGKGLLFLSGGHAGKSSLFINLIASKYMPLNDDIVFWTRIGTEIKLFACGTFPQIRKDAFKKVKQVDSIQHIDFNNLCSVSEFMSKISYNIDTDVILSAIFIPEMGYDQTSIIEVTSEESLRKKLRACMAHGNYEVDEKFLENFKILINCPTYRLCMSNNYNDICKAIDNFFETSFQK